MKGDVRQGVALFADLAGSTALYETLGNVAAAKSVRGALEHMSAVVAEHGGQVIKTVGDGVLAWFAATDAAAQAAITVQKTWPHDALPVRAAFHYGEAVHAPSDIFGDAVNVAARLAASAGPGEILTSRDTVSRLSGALATQTRPLGVEHLKGKAQPTHVFQVLWDPEREITRAVPAGDAADAVLDGMRALRIAYRRRKLVLTPRYLPFTFGRDTKASLPISSTLVSRSHARLEFHHGKFVLVDHSTNGTFLAPETGPEMQLRRESMPLLGRGAFGLGGRPQQHPDVTVEYSFE